VLVVLAPQHPGSLDMGRLLPVAVGILQKQSWSPPKPHCIIIALVWLCML